MVKIYLTKETRNGILYYGVWVGEGGSPRSGKFDAHNDLLALCPYKYDEAMRTANDIAAGRGLEFVDLVGA